MLIHIALKFSAIISLRFAAHSGMLGLTMKTITIKNGGDLKRTEFENLDELRAYLNIETEKPLFEKAHQQILDERLADRAINPDDHITIQELHASLNTSS